MKTGMIAVSVMYPAGEGITFNMDYYLNTHIPMVTELIGPAMESASIKEGLGGAEPGTPPAYLCISTMYFDTVEDFQNSFGPVADKIMADVPNYTNSQLGVQISKVVA